MSEPLPADPQLPPLEPALPPATPTVGPRPWTDIAPKVTAATLAYAVVTTVLSVLADAHVHVSAATSTAVAGLVPIVCAYLWPGR